MICLKIFSYTFCLNFLGACFELKLMLSVQNICSVQERGQRR